MTGLEPARLSTSRSKRDGSTCFPTSPYSWARLELNKGLWIFSPASEQPPIPHAQFDEFVFYSSRITSVLPSSSELFRQFPIKGGNCLSNCQTLNFSNYFEG